MEFIARLRMPETRGYGDEWIAVTADGDIYIVADTENEARNLATANGYKVQTMIRLID